MFTRRIKKQEIVLTLKNEISRNRCILGNFDKRKKDIYIFIKNTTCTYIRHSLYNYDILDYVHSFIICLRYVRVPR